MRTEEICLACGGKLEVGDLLHGRCQACREKGIPSDPRIIKKQEKEVLNGGKITAYRLDSHRLGRALRPLGLSMAGLVGLLIVTFTFFDDETRKSIPYALIALPGLIVIIGNLIFVGINSDWFRKTARSAGRSGLGWGIIGFLAYIIPAMLFSEFIFYPLVRARLTTAAVSYYQIISYLLAIIIGIFCALFAQCYFASRVIRKKVVPTTDPQELITDLINLTSPEQIDSFRPYGSPLYSPVTPYHHRQHSKPYSPQTTWEVMIIIYAILLAR